VLQGLDLLPYETRAGATCQDATADLRETKAESAAASSTIGNSLRVEISSTEKVLESGLEDPEEDSRRATVVVNGLLSEELDRLFGAPARLGVLYR